MKYFVKFEGHELKLIFFTQILVIVMLIANCFRPIELYIDDEVLKEIYYGEIQIEEDRNKRESRESSTVEKDKTNPKEKEIGE